MSARTVSILSFGLISGAFPAAGDVRIGVAVGLESVGTLVLPDVSNVRIGILYGADGTEYVGAFIDNAPTYSDSWTDRRVLDHMEMLSIWPESLRRKSVEASAIKSPDRKAHPMMQTGYSSAIVCTFDILGTEFDRLGMNPTSQEPKPKFFRNDIEWTIQTVKDDRPVDPIVQFDAARKQ